MLSNLVSSFFFYLLSQRQIVFIKMNFFEGFLVQLIFFGLTETLPLLSFVKVTSKFVEIIQQPAQNQVVPN
jgi:hypothetical protein